MCIIIHRESGQIPEDILDYQLVKNPDGFGVAWRTKKGDIAVERYHPNDAKRFRKRLRQVNKFPNETVVHFRTATHGVKDLRNCHPFEYTDADGTPMLLFHNGVIPIATDTESGESDTAAFARLILARMPYGFWNNPALKFLVESYIDWSRLLLMTPKETVILLGLREKWIQRDGVGYSTNPDRPYATKYDSGWMGMGSVKVRSMRSIPKEPMKRWHAGHDLIVSDCIPWGDKGDYVGLASCVSDGCQEVGFMWNLDWISYYDLNHVKGGSLVQTSEASKIDGRLKSLRLPERGSSWSVEDWPVEDDDGELESAGPLVILPQMEEKRKYGMSIHDLTDEELEEMWGMGY